MFIQNFSVGNQVNNTSIGTVASAAALMSPSPNFPDCMLINNGTVGIQVRFGGSSVVATNTAAAGGTNQVYIAAGAIMIVGTDGNDYFSAITDGGTESLIILVGAGS